MSAQLPSDQATLTINLISAVNGMNEMTALPRTGLPRLATLCLLLLLGGCASQAPEPQAPSGAPTPAPTDAQREQLRGQASRGDPESQFQLGSFYFAAKPTDLKQAERWWTQAANQGHAMAAVSLAFLYTGRTDPAYANPQAMLKYLNQSAAGGNPMAQHILGTLYLKGEQGVPRDPPQAKRLFQSACNQHYAASCAALNGQPSP